VTARFADYDGSGGVEAVGAAAAESDEDDDGDEDFNAEGLGQALFELLGIEGEGSAVARMRGAIGMAGDDADSDDSDEAEGDDDDDDDDDEAEGGGSDDEWPDDGGGDDESATAGLDAAVTVGGRGAAAAAGLDPVAAVTAGVGPCVGESGSKARPVEVVLAEMVYKGKGHGSEQARLRKAYLQPKWAHTNAEYRKCVTGLFEKALDGTPEFKGQLA
jgi:hypothetical protein